MHLSLFSLFSPFSVLPLLECSRVGRLALNTCCILLPVFKYSPHSCHSCPCFFASPRIISIVIDHRLRGWLLVCDCRGYTVSMGMRKTFEDETGATEIGETLLRRGRGTHSTQFLSPLKNQHTYTDTHTHTPNEIKQFVFLCTEPNLWHTFDTASTESRNRANCKRRPRDRYACNQ